MARELGHADVADTADLAEVVDAIDHYSGDLGTGEGADFAGHWLGKLYGNQDFLFAHILNILKDRGAAEAARNGYGAQVLMLHRQAGRYFMRVNFWPAADDPVLLASGASHYAYHEPHDHNFSFVTLGYHGPGYRSRWFTYENGAVAGYAGEDVALNPSEEGGLTPGRILHYRRSVDVHEQLPPDALSVSINIVAEDAATPWRDQYFFDLGAERIAALPTITQGEIALRMAAILGEDGRDLAHEFARHHPSHRMRWQAWRALGAATEGADRIALFERASGDASALVRGAAGAMLRCIEDAAIV
ncbi:MAG: transposase [Sphingomonadaceae bacterium]|nr:transposase [Sphingomonadaceae bacterium]